MWYTYDKRNKNIKSPYIAKSKKVTQINIYSIYSFYEQSKNNSLFPSDFFDSNANNKPKIKEEPNAINEDNKIQKSIFVNLQKEYDEDRELLELLNGTNKSKLYLY
jgi:hypothetical protein